MKLLLGSLVIISLLTWSSYFCYGADDLSGVESLQKFQNKQQQERKEFNTRQKSENIQFRRSIRNLTESRRRQAQKEHNARQFMERKAFHKTIREEDTVFLKKQFLVNSKLTDAQKLDLINDFENLYSDKLAARGGLVADNISFFKKIVNDPHLTVEQMKAALKKHQEKQRQTVQDDAGVKAKLPRSSKDR